MNQTSTKDAKDTKDTKDTKGAKPADAAAPAAGPAVGGIAAFAPAEAGKDWLTYNTNRKIYKPDLCHEYPVKGYLLDFLKMPEVDGEREWNTYVIRLTHPTIACDRDGNISKVEAGEEIMVPEVYDLTQCVTLRDACENPDETYEVLLKPIAKEKIGGGKSLWRYHIQFTPKAVKRTGALKLFVPAKRAVLQQAPNAAAEPPPFSA